MPNVRRIKQMRHPHPLMYWLAFGMPIFLGLVAGVKTWTEGDPTTSFASLAAKAFAIAVTPFLSVLVGLMLFGGVMLYLGTYRVGNHVRITGGDHDGKDAVITKYHGLTTTGWVHVRIESERLDTAVSPYQLQKIGIRSHIF